MKAEAEWYAQEYAWMTDDHYLDICGVEDKASFKEAYLRNVKRMMNLAWEFQKHALPYYISLVFLVFSVISIVGSILMREEGYTMGTVVVLVISGIAFYHFSPRVKKIRDEFQTSVNGLKVYDEIRESLMEKKKYVIEAENYLKAKNYEMAALLYEKAEMWEKAGEVRSMKNG